MTLLNLHAEVRGAINSVSNDITAGYQQSTGNTIAADGTQTPTYASSVNVPAQVQPVGNRDLRKYAFLQDQGIYRSVHLFGDIEGIVRSAQLGGDLLTFPMVPGGTVYTWLIKQVAETWNPGWCRVIVVMQTDPTNPHT